MVCGLVQSQVSDNGKLGGMLRVVSVGGGVSTPSRRAEFFPGVMQ